MRQDGSRELTLPSTCCLKRYNTHKARHCLTEKNLLFIGDSLTRYQFLGFAYFLEHNRWPPKFKTDLQCDHVDKHGNTMCSKSDDPNICMEEDWGMFGRWPSYIQEIGGGTDGGIFGGRMECQCV